MVTLKLKTKTFMCSLTPPRGKDSFLRRVEFSQWLQKCIFSLVNKDWGLLYLNIIFHNAGQFTRPDLSIEIDPRWQLLSGIPHHSHKRYLLVILIPKGCNPYWNGIPFSSSRDCSGLYFCFPLLLIHVQTFVSCSLSLSHFPCAPSTSTMQYTWNLLNKEYPDWRVKTQPCAVIHILWINRDEQSSFYERKQAP